MVETAKQQRFKFSERHMKDPTHCGRCGSQLSGGYCGRWQTFPGAKASKLIEAICFACDDLEQVVDYNKTKILTSRLITSAALNAVHDEYRAKRGSRSYGEPEKRHAQVYRVVHASYEKIRQEVKRFERIVWFGGLQSKVRGATNRGFKMTFGDTVAMVYTIAARTQITIERGDTQITVITSEDSTTSVMGINGIRATEKEALQLLVSCAKAYKGGAEFVRDDEVGIAGF